VKVVIAIPCLSRGGTEIQTLYLARALLQDGCLVCVVCYFEFDREVVDEYKAVGCEVILMKLGRDIQLLVFVKVLRDLFSEINPDVVHVQYMTPGALAILAARIAGIKKIIATVHQPYSSWHSLLSKILLRSSALLCDHFIAVSSKVEQSWFGSSRNFIGNERIRIPKHFTIYNAVDVSRVETLSRSEDAIALKVSLGLSCRFVFGYIGRLSREKGVDTLFDAFDILVQHCSDIDLLIVGDGPEKKSLEKRYSSKKWWKKVFFAGRQSWDNAMMHLAAMDAVIVPSRFEGFGLSVVEAMAASKPVIAAKTGGLMEIIENDRNGFLFQPENSAELASLMSILYFDHEKYNELSLNAHDRAADFDVSFFTSKVHNLYKQ
jgi:glycosyltransferase involved in cell wall biosynthesis